MNKDAGILPPGTETIAELRDLYREAEGRAARMRLISASERALAEADFESLSEIVQHCGDRLAFFVGGRGATMHEAGADRGIALRAPGPQGEVVGHIEIDSLESIDAIADPEDREAVRIQLDLIGTAIDRIRKEREKAKLLSTLQDREKSLEQLVERIFTAQEEERRRVSHELHDGVAQTATALVRILENAESRGGTLVANSGSAQPAEIARGLVSELRRVIAGLRPTLLDDLGLIPALQSLAESLEADGCTVTQRLETGASRMSPIVETALFRVAQEAVSNIRKHASIPCDVVIEANLDKETGDRVLRISDFGRGPISKDRKRAPFMGDSVGIEVMKERMAGIGGTLVWKAGKDRGVVVEAWLAKED
ncbi:MAG: histidine kinase [Erythrobacter sp.]|nr:histidine kinase [Erythrobacter sp.]